MRVLITGATGLIGSEIAELCREKEFGVNFLTTSKSKIEKQPLYRGYYWNPSTGEIDTACLEGVGAIINLAGASVFRRWTDSNKKKIIDSRINSANLLYDILAKNEHQVGQLISASAIGVYPHSYDKMYYEDHGEVEKKFLGKVVTKWETAADKFQNLGLRVAKVRIGIVLAKDGGALPKMRIPFNLNAGAVLGKGKQWQSWIHIKDLARIFLHVMENGFTGVFNAVAPNPVRHKELMQEIARSMGKRIWLPNVPAIVLQSVMGEMACTVLSSQLVASKKMEDTGFTFYYTNLARALDDFRE